MADIPKEPKRRPSCFVAMPITTPARFLEEYRGNSDHFGDVYRELISTAVDDAGFDCWPPQANATLDIRAEIIRKLIEADLVLVDLSSLNANVIFEFGVRTALDRPICLIADDLTKEVPFDFSGIHRQEYKSDLLAKSVRVDRMKLSEHIRKSFDNNVGGNAMWRSYGVLLKAHPPHGPTSSEEKIDYLMNAVESIGRSLTPPVAAVGRRVEARPP
jgi:hypothetical protein